MKKFLSTLLLLSMCCMLFVLPVSAEEQTSLNKYDEAEEYVSNIDFDYFYNSFDIGDDVKTDLKKFKNIFL